jgi:putative transposase
MPRALKITAPVQIVQDVQPLRFVQGVNEKIARHGAFWEDRYHATAIEADDHLDRCVVYIDLNMVRARVITHPGDWTQSGYREIQNPPKRYF